MSLRKNASKFINKLKNIAKFISSFKQTQKGNKKLETKMLNQKLKPLDEWILFELNETIKTCLKGYKELNFFIPSNALRNFLWNIFADHYIELVKTRAYKQDKSALFTLHKVLSTTLILLEPIIPQSVQELYKIYGDINKELFPELKQQHKIDFTTQELQELNSKIWKQKKDNSLSLKSEMSYLKLPKKFKSIAEDLKLCHNIKQLEFE